MTIASRQDVLGGLLLIGIGVGAVAEGSTLSVGHLTQMGAGYFPIVLGCILAGLGAILLVGGLVPGRIGPAGDTTFVRPDWRGCGAIVGGLLAFLIVGWRFGLAPATFACVFVAALGDRTATFTSSFLLALGVTVFGVLLFAYVLKVPFPVFRDDILSWSNWFGWVPL
jgi:hypothetical protein